MHDSDVAYGLLCDLEQTLTGVRSRLADLALLAAGAPPPRAGGHALVATVEPADELCAPEVPEPLVLPEAVDAPGVVLPEAGARVEEPVSAR